MVCYRDGAGYDDPKFWPNGRVVSRDMVMQGGWLPGGASPYGAFEMAGNAMEWTADWQHRITTRWRRGRIRRGR